MKLPRVENNSDLTHVVGKTILMTHSEVVICGSFVSAALGRDVGHEFKANQNLSIEWIAL
jgi:hypothetical protein